MVNKWLVPRFTHLYLGKIKSNTLDGDSYARVLEWTWVLVKDKVKSQPVGLCKCETLVNGGQEILSKFGANEINAGLNLVILPLSYWLCMRAYLWSCKVMVFLLWWQQVCVLIDTHVIFIGFIYLGVATPFRALKYLEPKHHSKVRKRTPLTKQKIGTLVRYIIIRRKQ